MHTRLSPILLALICLALVRPALAEDHAQKHHGDHHAGQSDAPAPMGARHGGTVQHTGARAYEFVLHGQAGRLFLYTHGMKPVAVRTPGKDAPQGEHAHHAGMEALAAGGSAVITTPTGQRLTAPLHPRKDEKTGATYLHLDLPAGLTGEMTVECTVSVPGKKPDTVRFENLRAAPPHPHGEI